MRVSTEDQKTDGQRDALVAAGVRDDAQHLFTDHGVSGKTASRPGLDACLAALRHGDTLVIAKLDRLGRSLGNLIGLFEELGARGVGVRVLDNPMLSTDGNAAQAKLMLGIFGALAEYERSLIVERTNVGLAAARARGRNGGRPRVVADDPRVVRAKELHAAGHLTPTEIAKTLGVGVSTLYRWLAKTPATDQ
ncbi:DNA invertase Pin-like site-specific DNA recombinase [Sinomonas atrocyanea]|uniref:recombinase family protein n=1 Tax=Sinomonas atrocyanea TaxID=37927 RepID=UPI00278773CC|nr:recombinase family protein [Sinomonas atrocyanea]MDP9885482.1 DNA invertase Pin-like site-specific DNA recombinase [Sinomonas atrocyanea]